MRNKNWQNDQTKMVENFRNIVVMFKNLSDHTPDNM